MGRHAADEGAGVHPIVAAALQRQAPESLGGLRHASGRRPATAADGGLGWPGSPPDGTGLGWPADAQIDRTPAGTGAVAVLPEEPTRRRAGWRRFFGGAAVDKPRGSSAA
ncbi:hypothetical protein SAMN05661080_00397 [Modestobacter sp. DSM 44400]|uniref:hypothetical protein n=1 Tax=Modestobacter sp. DSM 44400 TaxID=1550230 RepID=UPI00089AF706|nr:hypothetical protein [Modestobacter sp. DSM 44400]SDX54252.1 hypothetical protein SAMN05661080_00397 [Modestobacter sp. DSM 44400]